MANTILRPDARALAEEHDAQPAIHHIPNGFRIDLDDEGRIGGIFAPDRQFTEGKIVEERPWSGQFLDYRRCLGRWLPYGAEVGWTIDGQAQKYWRGAITSWTVA